MPVQTKTKDGTPSFFYTSELVTGYLTEVDILYETQSRGNR